MLNLKNFQKGFIKITKKSLVSLLIFLVVFFGTGLIYLFNPFTTKEAEAVWFDDNWKFRKAILITNSGSAETNVTGSISSYDASDATRYQTDCGDVRFTKQNGEVLPYTVATCGATTTFTVVFDSLPAGTQDIYLYYGNPTSPDGFLASTSASACASCSAGSTWTITDNGTSSISYVNVKDSIASPALTATTSYDSGNNTGWTISGKSYSGTPVIRIQGGTTINGGTTIQAN